MFNNKISDELFNRYLNILRISSSEPSLNQLSSIVAAHLYRVPFENISKLYYKKTLGRRTLPGLSEYLDGIEIYHFGGTCYANNYYLYLLLKYLGYDIMLCGADMANPDVHLASIVKLDDREYMVDVGYAAPFDHPLPRDLDHDYEIKLGNNRYVLKPRDSQGRSEMELHRNGIHKHGYVVKPVARSIEHFTDVIAHSFTGEATFTNALLLVRMFPNRSIVIHNLHVIESEGMEQRIVEIPNRAELAHVIEHYFNIPKQIAAEAIAELGELGDAWN